MKRIILSLMGLAVMCASYAQDVFYKGVDMGWLTEMESRGWKCYDNQGNERECMSLMADYGINAQRIRVWVDPSAHGNWCNKEDVLVKCKRARALNQEIMIDFHYSDWWADPAKQNIPAAWKGHSYEQMKQDLANHTIEVLTYLRQNRIVPKWVQVGNETSNGMLWSVRMNEKGWEWKDENGKTQIIDKMGHAWTQPEQYAGFFKAGYDAVKSVFPKSVVIVHLDNGFDNDLYNRNLDILVNNGAKFDMIGMSIYPYWSMQAGKEPSAEKTITDCIANINKVSSKYHVPVMITETGFLVDEMDKKVMEEGRDNLARLIRECMTMTHGRCKGVFYWEPQCRPSQYKLGAFTNDGRPTVIMDGFLAQNDLSRKGLDAWPDTRGKHINAHGGCVQKFGDKYYWYGENRPYRGFTTEVGVEVYSSTDLLHWTDEGVALSVSESGEIERGCIMERPKVLYCEKTRKYVMLFHLELKGKGYEAARVGFAESDSPVGPFRYVRSLRPNAGKWPVGMSKKQIKEAKSLDEMAYKEWWTPDWRKAIEAGLFLKRDMAGGQMSRDMTVYIDDDGKAYHIFSSEDNLTIQIAELTEDYMGYTGKYTRVAPGGQNEAPTILKRDGVYWMITSGCTGWAPNAARMFRATNIWGPWTQYDNPFKGAGPSRQMGADKSFGTQGTWIINHPDGTFTFMADIWIPDHLSESRHVWLPIQFDNDGVPFMTYK